MALACARRRPSATRNPPKCAQPRAVWRPKPSLATAAEAWLEAGGPHHTAFSQALTTEIFADFAEIAGIELVTIDAATTIGGVKKELRWNQAYHHLARGL